MQFFGNPADRCPICGSADINEAPQNQLPATDNFYLQYARERLGVDFDTFNRATPVFECRECTTVFCNPWLKYEYAFEVFNNVYGQHNGGWDAYYHWLNQSRTHDYVPALEAVSDMIGGFSSYAEVNCPFHGNLMHLRQAELNSVDPKTLHKACVGYLTASHCQSSDAFSDANKYSAMHERYSARQKDLERVKQAFTDSGVRRYLFHEDSALCWGASCVSDGVSCKSLAVEALNVRVLTLREAIRQNVQVDVVGIYNILDHLIDPMATLRELLQVSRHVILINHAQEIISKQHLFVLRPGFMDYLSRQGYRVHSLDPALLGVKVTENADDKLACLISHA